MNESSESAFSRGAGTGDRSRGPWWSMPLPNPPPHRGARQPPSPGALWRLVEIGETAGLITAKGRDEVAAVLQQAETSGNAVRDELQRFQVTPAELYVLVTLFTAAARAVTAPILAEETRAEPGELREALDHLAGIGALGSETTASGEAGLRLTPCGSRLAVLLIYRVITAAS